eukprot:5525992-Alexandrium_andersonii.AAC.1
MESSEDTKDKNSKATNASESENNACDVCAEPAIKGAATHVRFANYSLRRGPGGQGGSRLRA